jgi:site-specific recombinase XerD
MLQFKSLLESSSVSDYDITQFMDDFSSKPNESLPTRQKRRTLMRQFADYLNKHGIMIPVPKSSEDYYTYSKRIPYIYSKQELAAIFREIDCWEVSPLSRSNRTITDPLIFRMAYGCGMRIIEILTLRHSDVDTDAATIYVRNGKNGRERLIPMAPNLVCKCSEYNKTMHTGAMSSVYYFPGRNKQNHSSYEAACQRFKEYLWKAGIIRTDKGSVIHDLRHTYCVHRLKEWALSGADVSNLHPYMSAFLGHADFRGTEYYLRLTADPYPEIARKMDKEFSSVIPTWIGGERIAQR